MRSKCFNRGGGGSRSFTRHAKRRRDFYEDNRRDDPFRVVKPIRLEVCFVMLTFRKSYAYLQQWCTWLGDDDNFLHCRATDDS